MPRKIWKCLAPDTIFRTMAREGRLNKRFFCLVSAPLGNNPDAVTSLPEKK
jgi:hypothetical protein